jgi:hypothetical protein
MLLALNAFHISTHDVIIYGSEGEGDTFNEWYESYEKSGSKGIEMVYSIRKKNWYGHLTYSFSQALNDNTVDKYVVPQTTKQYIGIAAHKLTLNTNFNLTPKLSMSPTFVFSSKRYAYTNIDEDGELVSRALDPYLLTNLFFNYRNLFPGFTMGAGVYDLFNVRPEIPQAYNGGLGAYAPVPGRSREFVIKLSYHVNFTK